MLAKNYFKKSLNLKISVCWFFLTFRRPKGCCPNTKWDPTEGKFQGKTSGNIINYQENLTNYTVNFNSLITYCIKIYDILRCLI